MNGCHVYSLISCPSSLWIVCAANQGVHFIYLFHLDVNPYFSLISFVLLCFSSLVVIHLRQFLWLLDDIFLRRQMESKIEQINVWIEKFCASIPPFDGKRREKKRRKYLSSSFSRCCRLLLLFWLLHIMLYLYSVASVCVYYIYYK